MMRMTAYEAITMLTKHYESDEPILIGWWDKEFFANELIDTDNPDEVWETAIGNVSEGFDRECEAIADSIQRQIVATIEEEN